MKSTLMPNSFWAVIVQSTPLSKVILVLASLVLILCFFIFIYKILLLREKNRQIAQLQESLQAAQTLEEIIALGSTMRGTLPGAVLGRGLVALKGLLSAHPESKKLTDLDMMLLQDSLDQALQEVMHKEHRYVSVLSVSYVVAPLVGLFGTVSGLIQAFIAIGHEKSADIAAIAPGIAEALVATFAGLVVAIPAIIMYHYLTEKIDALEGRLYALVHHFEWVSKKILG